MLMTNRPLPAGPRYRRRTLGLAALAFVSLLGAKGCDSNAIGVQDYGTVYGNVVDGSGKPIAQALVSATGTTTTVSTERDGAFSLVHVAVGEQTVTVRAAGFTTATADVIVTKDKNVAAGNIALASTVAH